MTRSDDKTDARSIIAILAKKLIGGVGPKFEPEPRCLRIDPERGEYGKIEIGEMS
jgi:hypothetical protein